MIRRTLDPNPNTRITMAGIKENEWFKTDYHPASPGYDDDDEEGSLTDQDDAISTPDEVYVERERETERETSYILFLLVFPPPVLISVILS